MTSGLGYCMFHRTLKRVEITPGLSADGDWAGWGALEEMYVERRMVCLLRSREHQD